MEFEFFDTPVEAASPPPASIPEIPRQSSPTGHPEVSLEDLAKTFAEVDASERQIQRGKYVWGSSSLEMPEDIFPMEYHMGKGVGINLKPLCFLRIFNN